MPELEAYRGELDLPASPDGKKRRNHCLLIAIDEYVHFSKLANCVRDAEGVKSTLCEEYAFEEDHITTLFDREATGERIVGLLEDLPAKLTPDDNLLLYFSGHGIFRESQKQGFWAPVDARPGVTKDLISFPELRMYLNPLPCHHLVLIIDACYSGSLLLDHTPVGKVFQVEELVPQAASGLAPDAEEVTPPDSGTAGKVIPNAENAPSRCVLTSGRLEKVYDGRPGQHSPFAESLIKQLHKNWSPLRIDTLAEQIKDDLQKLGFRETPDFDYLTLDGNQRGIFIFQPRPEKLEKEKTRDLEFPINQSTLRVVYGDITAIEADAVVSSDDTMLSMSAGVSGSIRMAAGPELRATIDESVPRPVQVGDVVETAAFGLGANYIFHTITLDYHNQLYADDAIIAAMTRRCLELADERQLNHLAFPAIGTGTAALPFEPTARAMTDTICQYLNGKTHLKTVTIVLFPSANEVRKKAIQTFYEKAIRQGNAWIRLRQYLSAMPELLETIDKQQLAGDIARLGKSIFGEG